MLRDRPQLEDCRSPMVHRLVWITLLCAYMVMGPSTTVSSSGQTSSEQAPNISA